MITTIVTEFQKQVEEALNDIFDSDGENKSEIQEVSEKAAELKLDLENNDEVSFELTVDMIKRKLQERSVGGPEWAWKNWIGTLEAFNIIPDGYQ